MVCCSNGQKHSARKTIQELENVLLRMGIHTSFSNAIYEKAPAVSASAGERARALMNFYKNDEIKGIFDISGGDLANGILPDLDYHVIADSPKTFCGYSDLTTVLNAIYTKTGRSCVLYQIRNLVYDNRKTQTADFQNTVQNGRPDLFQLRYHFIQQKEMHGIVIGGNIRCFLKLAGTEYMPDFKGKILLLESYHGTAPQIETYLRQLQQLGAFQKAAGILLGTFTQMQAKSCVPTVEMLVQEIAGRDLPLAVTPDIGHGTDSKGIIIGQERSFSSYRDTN
ncbi:MAG: LD-carboxypeptidase [Clostridiaceae bacterium]|nr:LD-carboxypeptidase [Lachnospiraceae bacterium]MCI8881359.1 LD-carboxypeptidase [Clostridiaceae bacterium]